MLRQIFTDALITLQITGSIATAILVAAAPIARLAVRHSPLAKASRS
ncbi:MAG: hypothetical protein ACRCSO_04885 [Sphingomonas sp.]